MAIKNAHLVEVYEKWCKKNPPYDGYWGAWPMCYDEMPLKEKDIIFAIGSAGTGKTYLAVAFAVNQLKKNI